MPNKPEEIKTTELSRRGFLTTIASGIAMTLAAPAAMAAVAPARVQAADSLPVRDRELSFYNTHTGEQLSATFWEDGDYLDDGVEEISWILRDHRADIASPIDPKLLDLLYRLQAKIDRQDEFHVISGYRCPATNAMLHKKSSGVAKRSYHMLGQAIDVRLPGFDTAKLHQAAKSLKGGGVGYYAKSDFVHIDVGPVRYW
jgi:uncharacterized protein YcbK (DUF882 family)